MLHLFFLFRVLAKVTWAALSVAAPALLRSSRAGFAPVLWPRVGAGPGSASFAAPAGFGAVLVLRPIAPLSVNWTKKKNAFFNPPIAMEKRWDIGWYAQLLMLLVLMLLALILLVLMG